MIIYIVKSLVETHTKETIYSEDIAVDSCERINMVDYQQRVFCMLCPSRNS